MKKILVVEDRDDVRSALVLVLKAFIANAEITEAESLSSARQKLRELTPDIVITDVDLNDGPGFDLIPDYRAKNPHVFVVVMSGRHDNLSDPRADLADLTLCKPFTVPALVEGLKKAENRPKNPPDQSPSS